MSGELADIHARSLTIVPKASGSSAGGLPYGGLLLLPILKQLDV